MKDNLFKASNGVEFIDISTSVIGQPVFYYCLTHPTFGKDIGLIVSVFLDPNTNQKSLDIFKHFSDTVTIPEDSPIFKDIMDAIDELAQFTLQQVKDKILKGLNLEKEPTSVFVDKKKFETKQ